MRAAQPDRRVGEPGDRSPRGLVATRSAGIGAVVLPSLFEEQIVHEVDG
jgi:hypothetical protein